MKRSYRWLIPGTLLIATLGLAGCEVEQTEEGSMPEVEVEGGNLPEYDVEGPDVDVGTRQETITVPDIDVDLPGDDDEMPMRDPNEPVR